ncbi:MAG: hypothetical protein LUI87_10915 [Lachnospiraceae bacterium]|nr:hypothetical protein [Lachnospiraceae bacterium]
MGYFANKRNLQEEKAVVSDAHGRDESIISGNSGDHLDVQKWTESDSMNEKKRIETKCLDEKKKIEPECLYEKKVSETESQDVRRKSREKTAGCGNCVGNSSCMIDFLKPGDEMQTEKDFRMLQGMYPAAAKELLPLIEEECDRMEYEGSAMFDEYPDYTTIYTLQRRISEAAQKAAEADGSIDMEVSARDMVRESDTEMAVRVGTREPGQMEDTVLRSDLIRVMLLQEMHRRRSRYRSCADGEMR